MSLPRYSLRKLAYFTVAADVGTVTEAAKQLNITQSALSDALSSLENEIGIQLLLRKKAKGIELTEAGAKILQQVRLLLSQFEEFEFALENIEHRIRGEIRIGCYTTLSPTVIPKLLNEMNRRFPEIHLTVIEAAQDVLQQMLNESKIEAAFVYNVDVQETFEFLKLTESVLYILMSPKHRLAKHKTIALEDIAEDKLISLDLKPSQMNTENFFAHFGLKPNVWQKTKSIELTRSLVGYNLGYTLLMHRAKGRTTSLEGFPLLIKEIKDSPPATEIGIMYKRDKITSRKFGIIKEVLQDIYSSDGFQPV